MIMRLLTSTLSMVGFEATVTMVDGAVAGDFPRRARGLVLEWSDIHRDELLANWQRAEGHLPLQRIPPLE